MSSGIKVRFKSVVFWGLLAALPACEDLDECNGKKNPFEPVRSPAISLVPITSAVNVVPGSSTDVNVTVQFVDGTNTAELRASGLLPTGVKVRFQLEIVTLAIPTTTMTVIADSTARPGPLAFEIVAATPAHPIILVTRTGVSGVIEKPFTLTPPDAQVVTAGTTPAITIGIGRRPGFASDVGLSLVSGTVPAGTEVRFTSATNAAQSTVLSLVLPDTARLGVYQVRTVGKYGNNQDTAQFSMTVQARPVPPEITILAVQSSVTAVPGATATYNLALSRNSTASGIAGDFRLSVDGLPTGATVTFTPAAPRDAAQMIVAVPSTVRDDTYRLSITAMLGTLVKTITVDLVVATPPNFTLKLTPAAITVNRGGSTEVEVELQRTGPASNIVLDAQGVPGLVSVTPAPAVVGVTGTSSRITVAVNSLASAGNHTITIRGTSGSLTKSATLTLTIPQPPPSDVSIRVLTPTTTVVSGGTTQIPIRITRTGTAIGALLELRSTGVPTGGYAWITPSTTLGDSATLNVISGAAGNYNVAVSVVRGASPPTDIAAINVTATNAGDFSILPAPQTLSLPIGSPISAAIQIGRTNGFVGAVSFVAITEMPSDYQVAFSLNSTIGSGMGMTITASSNVPAGPHVIRLRGTSGSIVHEVSMTVDVTAATPYPYPYPFGIKRPPE